MYKFSAVICTYNRERFLRQSIESLINQTFPNEQYEIIVVDNNSTDNTDGLVKDLILSYPQSTIKLVQESQQGLSYARNKAWEISEAEFLYYLDDDGIASPNLLEEFYSIIKADQRCVGCGGKIDVNFDPNRTH